MQAVLNTDKLTKTFGKIRAVRQLDLDIRAGQVFGILGPNGSGKTTTLGMILGVVKPTSGSYNWFGKGDSHHLRKRIGAIIEHPVFYPFLSAVENLRISAHIKDVANPEYDRLLTMVGLYERRNDAFKTYSLGMKQRLAIATALVSDPEVLIFDEPTNGLDPQGIADIRKLILDIAAMGKTIILASHLLDEVQKVCSDFAVLRTGEKIFQGSVEHVLNQKQRIEIFAEDHDQLRRELENDTRVLSLEHQNGLFIIEVKDELTPAALNKTMFDKGLLISHLAMVRSNLEETFLEILEKMLAKAAKLEYLKFRRYRPFWIILGLFVLAFFAVGFSIKSLVDFFVRENANDLGKYLDNGLPLFDFVDIWQNLAYISFLFKYILAFVVVISICLEYSNKTIRQNMIDGLSHREYLASKLSLMVLLSLIAGLLLTLLGLTLGLMYSPVKSFDFIILNMEFVPAYMLEVFCFLALAMFLATLIRRTGFAIVLFVLYSLAIEPIATAVMEFQYKLEVWYFPMKSINNLIHVPFGKYIFREVQDYVSLREIGVAVFWTLLWIFLSYRLMKKRDT